MTTDVLTLTATVPEPVYLFPHMNTQHLGGGTPGERRGQVAFSKKFPAGLILQELFNMEVLADDGEGNRAWGIPYDAADNPGWGERYRHADPDAAPPAWLGEVQFTTHRLENDSAHEIAILHSNTILPEFPFTVGRWTPMGSYVLVKAWLRDTRFEGTVVSDSLLAWLRGRPVYGQVMPRLRSARALVDVQNGKAGTGSIHDLTGAPSAAVRWAINVPASFILGLNPNLRRGDDNKSQQRWRWATTPLEGRYWSWLEIQTKEVGGIEVAYWLDDINLEVPGMESRYAPASSYGMLVAAVGSREAAKEIMEAYPVPSVELRETIQLFIDSVQPNEATYETSLHNY